MNAFHFDEELFGKNVDLFSQIDPLAAQRLQLMEANQLSLCHTKKGELNLLKTRQWETDYYHSQEGALEEAYAIIKDQIPEENDVIYFYGIGLAYVYEALQPWLKKNSKHHLVFLEDDLEVLFYFFYTERATRVLQEVDLF